MKTAPFESKIRGEHHTQQSVVLFPNWSPERRCEHVVGPDSRVPIGSQGMVWETAPEPSQFPRQIPEARNKFLPTLPSNEENEKKEYHFY